MSLYGLNSTLFDIRFSDAVLIESMSSSHQMISDRRGREREEENLLKISNSILQSIKRNSSPSKHRHDGTSPLPLGMDWSPPPRNWDGPNIVWPNDFHTGWSYSVTIPSWSIFAESRGSEPVVFYRVQIGLQSPVGVTTTSEVLKRFSDFLKLSSDFKRSFRDKKLSPVPPKGLLRVKNRTFLEDNPICAILSGSEQLEKRRCSLEAWMAKVLSDIDFSRSAPVACFLELEAAARTSFRESSHHVPDVNLSCNNSSSSDPSSGQIDVSVVAGTSALASNYNNNTPYVKDNSSDFYRGTPISDNEFARLTEATADESFSVTNNSTLSRVFGEGKEELLQKSSDGRSNLDPIQVAPSYALSHHNDTVENSTGQENSPMMSHAKGLLGESLHKDTSSATPSEMLTSWEFHQDRDSSSKCSESAETSKGFDTLAISDFQFSPDALVILPSDEQQKMNRLLSTMQQRCGTSKTDVEDLIARLNQELAVRQYLTTKVKDLETELKSTKQAGKENLEQALSVERERFTQMQWGMEELRRKNMEMEFRLKAEQDEKTHAEATRTSIIKENEALRRELDSAKEQLKNLQKSREEADLKSKLDVKLLIKEVKSLRSSQSELQKELERVSKERNEFETRLQKERGERESADAANRKLFHECEIIRGRLEECSVNFLFQHESKEFPPDALDILVTSENRIGLLLAEAQLLAQDIATPVASSSHESNNLMTMGCELRKILTDVLIDSAILRKQANSVIRCALNMTDGSANGSPKIKGDTPLKETVISELFEK